MPTDLSKAVHNLGINRAGAYFAQIDGENLELIRQKMLESGEITSRS